MQVVVIQFQPQEGAPDALGLPLPRPENHTAKRWQVCRHYIQFILLLRWIGQS